ncbi:mucin-13 [Callospermophilus lateralis]
MKASTSLAFLALLFISSAIANSSSPAPFTNATEGPPTNATEGPPTNATEAPPTNATEGPPTNATGGPPTNATGGPPTNATGGPPTNATGGPPTNATEAPPTNATEAPPTNATEGPPTNATEAPPTNATEAPPTNATEGPPTNATEAPPTNATEAPPTNATEGPPTNATEAPPTNSTEAPPTNATEGPPTNATEGPPTNATEAPPTNATEGPPTNVTEAPPTNTTKAPPNTGSTPTPQVNSSVSSDPCQVRPCGGGAACINLHDNNFCLCAEGYYYSTSSCLKGKTFPGEITVQVQETTGLDNKNSEAYERLHDDIISFFQNVFGHSDYGQTVILQVSLLPSLSGRSEMRADMKLVDASVINILKESTNLTEKDVNDEIEKAVKKSNFTQSYNPIDSCEFYGCVKKDQDCSNSLQCECKPGLQRPNMLSPYCLPLECSANCSAEFNKQCIKKENKELQCVCLPGFEGDANDVCQACPFGYGGVDCKDQFQLILTIVGTIAAVLILALLISLVFSTRSKNKKSDIEEENLIDNDFQNLRLQSTGFSNLEADGSIFPKVRTTASKDLQSQNPYANQRREPRTDY